MSLRMEEGKKKTLEEMRRLMAERKKRDKPGKINNPLAKYNKFGQLTCVLCSSIVRSENVWLVHVNSKQHRENIEQAKKLTNHFTDGKVKLKRPGTSPTDLPPEKKIKGILKNVSTSVATLQPKQQTNTTHLLPHGQEILTKEPVNIINSNQNNSEEVPQSSSLSKEIPKTESVSEHPIPEGFFDDPKLEAKVRNIEYKDPEEEEWERFQKEIKEETTNSTKIIAGEEEEATADRQIDYIDEQIQNWSRVLDIQLKLEDIRKDKGENMKTSDSDNDNIDSDSEEDFNEDLDWRAKKSFK